MAMSIKEIEGRFSIAFPEKEQRALFQIVMDGYRDAALTCRREYGGPEGADLLGHMRRAKIDRGLRGVGDAFPDLISGSNLNKANNSHHATLRSRNVLLTASRTEGPGSVPREAIFRRLYAQDPQLDLFEPNEAPPELYGILYHCPDPDDESKPGAVIIGFPTRDTKHFIHTIDLQKKFGTGPSTVSGEPEPYISEGNAREGGN